jgi:hypothetical protein
MKHRSTSRLIAAVLVPVAVLVALIAWGVSSPAGSSPDDDYHMASIWCATGAEEGMCETTADPDVRVLPSDLLQATCFVFDANRAATCPRDENTMTSTDRGNWNGEAYPPLYYVVMHAFAGDDLSASIIAIRTFNAVLYVGLLTALFFLLPIPRRSPLVWGAALTAVPLGMFLIPSVNPSSWAVLSGTGLWLAAWGFFGQRGVRKVLLAVLTVVFLVIGAGARSDSAAYAVLALIAASVLAFRRERSYFYSLALPVALFLVAVAFFFSGGQAAVVGGETVVQNQSYSFSVLAFIDIKQLPQLLAGVFGVWGLGWLDTSMPGIVWVSTMTVFAAVAFWGLQRADARKWISLAGIAASVVAVPLYILLHDGVVVGNGVQPRYVFPLIIVFAGIAVTGFRRGSLGLGRVQLLIVAIALTIANSVALHVNIRRYVTGVDLPGVNLDRDIEWWWNAPISPMGVWIIGSVAFAVAAAALSWVATRRASEPIDGPADAISHDRVTESAAPRVAADGPVAGADGAQAQTRGSTVPR